MQTLTVSPRNINKVIRSLKKSVTNVPESISNTLILPISYPVLSSRYRGKGRPRKSDYDYVNHDWDKIFKEYATNTKHYFVLK